MVMKVQAMKANQYVEMAVMKVYRVMVMKVHRVMVMKVHRVLEVQQEVGVQEVGVLEVEVYRALEVKV
jgi:hypothetical protein